MHNHGNARGTEKAKDFSGTFARLFRYLKPYCWFLLAVIIFAIASTVFSIIGPKILSKATDKLIAGISAKIQNTGGIDFTYINKILLLLLGLYLLSMLFNYVQSWITSGISQKVAYSLRKDIAEKIDRLPLSFFDKHASGDILSRITNDVDTIAQSLNQSMAQIITSTVTVVGVVIMMFTISWQLTLIALAILPVTFGILGMVMSRSQKYYIGQQKALGDADGHIEEMYGAHQIVQAFNGEAASVATFKKYNDELYTSGWKSQFFGSLMMPISNLVGNIGYVGICIAGGFLAVNSVVTIGDIQAFIQYVKSFTQPITQMAQIINLLQSTAAASERVFDFLEAEEMLEEEVEISTEEAAKLPSDVTFDHVRFGYNPDKIIIKDFSLDVSAGQKIAIVGPTGAGKTTLVKLLMRFYELNSGKITIGGQDISKMKRSDLRSMFGMVLQDTWLFNGTIKENLRYGKLNASDEELRQAAIDAHADHFIEQMPEGYDSMINEESSNISAGQKQLLTIARAFVKDPKILILDEATSSVDTRTELLIQQGMDRLMQGRTAFVIAHRLSTIRDADSIIVLKDGDIVEVGNHDSLMAKKGFYADLYQSQFEHSEE
ncbi:ABC transporter ATP-binding protein [Lactobacillus delbrueckii subsp. allosunkii]|uniref:ABC transporter ATP-binding protein/permease n=1 Tax=Lactobacillus delbrueckii subsp. allosunkii TaxID=1050107 RepID=A0ABD4SBF2_9LACO|nr:ABC transporter ATP-binding protein [Lactobacillus delbrueckii]MCD5517653.1 ABC transporter ATP-binding protein/permease [Lactobacillus delbrueckii subsp. sunkii]MCT3476109.1 ABC transporter ATP-binding protein [Lactobacillus delbrueckii subsp. lactis]MCZ0776702.1 ABC transporter ATP-binding protein [Lactobacillus delbrueckii subsp. sunkii]MCZ0787754.1 ABC transporter ATP-binding protein [Lactobacillus delbrueckii subsp. sunkii]MCZ0794004.1 ABC transporter ATP-binding protein [Lactobacillus